jgi:RNA 2',3'-cyclic 3'-phosphodiesterase
MSRLFVAILPPLAVRTELTSLSTELAMVRWTPEENLHLTLRYIGDTAVEKEAALGLMLEQVRVEPFILPVGHVGVFPSRGHPKVLWAGIGTGHTRLFQLRKQVDEALLSVDMTLDVHHFHPHFTLGRIGDDCAPKMLAKFAEKHAEFEAPPFRVNEFQLMASDVQTGRAPVYRVVRTFALND